MSISSEPESLRVDPGISRRLVIGLVAAHGAALAVVIFTPTLSIHLKALLALLILVGLADALRTHVLRLGRVAVRSALHLGAGEWELQLGDGTGASARLACSLVLPALVVMRFSLGRGRRRSLVIPRDALPRDAHRRLRVLMLAQAGTKKGNQSERGE